MKGNALLAARIASSGMKQSELADALNVRIESFTGRMGTLEARHIRNWLNGTTQWPHARQRRALEEEFGCSAQELGFIPISRRRAPAPPAPSEDPVRRRTFAGSAAAIAAAAALPPVPATAAPRIGMSDADRLDTAFNELVVADNAHGGTISLETRALAFAHHAMEMQSVGTATQRVRSRLYYLAAAFTGTAMWAAFDAHESERAQRHLERGLTLAGLSGNPEIQFRLWGHAALVAYQQHRVNDAVAAGLAARTSSVCRRDPLFRSLAAARLAGVQAGAGDRSAALRSLDQAATALDRTDAHKRRPVWMQFYDQAEFNGLAALTMSRIGRYDEAEAFLHRTLARLRPEYTRNRAYYTANLALAQLHQDDLELACDTAATVHAAGSDASLTARTEKLLTAFTRTLNTRAPGSQAATLWAEQHPAQGGSIL